MSLSNLTLYPNRPPVPLSTRIEAIVDYTVTTSFKRPETYKGLEITQKMIADIRNSSPGETINWHSLVKKLDCKIAEQRKKIQDSSTSIISCFWKWYYRGDLRKFESARDDIIKNCGREMAFENLETALHFTKESACFRDYSDVRDHFKEIEEVIPLDDCQKQVLEGLTLAETREKAISAAEDAFILSIKGNPST